ncbi:MAG: gamma-glutamyl-phosphate reductase, partial [Novosphingobium sp.]
MSSQPATPAQSVTDLVEGLARASRTAQRVLARMDAPAKERALKLAAATLRNAEAEILAANAQDMANGEANGLTGAMLDRLKLTPERLAGIADAVEQVASLADPVGEVISGAARPNGMVLQRVRIPVGVIGIIYESRPNVTADAAALCVR